MAWLLLSFLISYVIEWGLLSGQLHGSDYFAGHLWPSSAWLNVMDGEEMVMSETLASLARFQPLYNYNHTVWLSPNKTPHETHWRTAPWPHPCTWSIRLLNVLNIHIMLLGINKTQLFVWIYTHIIISIRSYYMLPNVLYMPFFVDPSSNAHNVALRSAI